MTGVLRSPFVENITAETVSRVTFATSSFKANDKAVSVFKGVNFMVRHNFSLFVKYGNISWSYVHGKIL